MQTCDSPHYATLGGQFTAPGLKSGSIGRLLLAALSTVAQHDTAWLGFRGQMASSGAQLQPAEPPEEAVREGEVVGGGRVRLAPTAALSCSLKAELVAACRRSGDISHVISGGKAECLTAMGASLCVVVMSHSCGSDVTSTHSDASIAIRHPARRPFTPLSGHHKASVLSSTQAVRGSANLEQLQPRGQMGVLLLLHTGPPGTQCDEQECRH